MLVTHEEFVRGISEKIEKAKQTPLSLDVESHIVFLLHGHYYGIPSPLVIEILRVPPLTPVPGAPPYVQGIFMHRSKVVPVIDFARRFLLNTHPPRVPEQIIILESEGISLAFLVERVIDATMIHHEALHGISDHDPERISPEYLLGIFDHEYTESETPFRYDFFIAAPRFQQVYQEDSGERHLRVPVFVLGVTTVVRALFEGL